MGLFKSREERRIERDMEVRKGLAAMKRQIKGLEKHERDYLTKARRAKALGDDGQLNFLKGTLKRTAAQRRMLERQLLSLETAQQLKNQAEIHSTFARSMNAVSNAISEAFGSTDLEKTQRDFEKAVARAENMEQRMDLLLEMGEEMMSAEPAGVDEVISDPELDQLIEGGAAESEGAAFDQEIADRLKRLDKELGE
ncbi:MAG: hypothetical protein ACYTHM_13635 [Planctomycetota bacterium]|jgi:hypothetical protein